MKRIDTSLLTIGWIGAILVPIVGIAVGLYVASAKATNEAGLKTSKYDDWSRKQAFPMVVIALLIILISIWLRARSR